MTLVGLALLLGTGVSLWQARRAIKSEQLANERLENEKKAKAAADVNYQRALSAVDRMLRQVGGSDLHLIPKMLPVQRQLLEDAIKFYEELISENPDDPELLYQAASAYYSLVAVHGSLREDINKRGALTRRGVELLEKIDREYLQERKYSYSLVISYWDLGRWNSNREEQASVLHRALVVAKKHVDQHSQDSDLLAIIYAALGEHFRKSQPVEAERYYRLAISSVACKSSWECAVLGEAHAMFGKFLRDSGRLEEAEREYRESIFYDNKSGRYNENSVPEKTRFGKPDRISRHYEQLGKLLAQTGRTEMAEKNLRLALKYTLNNKYRFPNDEAIKARDRSVRNTLASFLRSNDRADEADEMLREIADQMSPRTAEEYVQRAKLHEQLREYDKALADYEKVKELGSDSAPICNNAAWGIVKSPGMETELIQRAVKLAQMAVELAPEDGGIWNTLGVAHYRAGDWNAAIESLEKSLTLRGDNSLNFFFLAMAHWQLGQKDKARQRYDQAVQWMKKNKPNDEELIGFRTEATELLGITNPNGPPPPALPTNDD